MWIQQWKWCDLRRWFGSYDTDDISWAHKPSWICNLKDMEKGYERRAIYNWNEWYLGAHKMPHVKKAIKVKYVFNLKHNLDGQIAKHRAMLVGRSFRYRQGLNY